MPQRAGRLRHPRLERASYNATRVWQSYRAFANWPTVLGQLAGRRGGHGGTELRFRTRSGVRITTPNVPGARLPVYEQFAEDCYDLAGILAGWRGRPVHVFDIGAHVGSFALNAAQLHPSARVTCFEPSASSAAYLRRNIAANGMADRIEVRPVALSDSEGTARFDDNDGASVHSGLMRNDSRMVDGDDTPERRHAVEVPTTTFDAAVAAAAAPPELVKMDCEGGEYPLVYASDPASWRSVERVVMEYHPVAGQSWAELRGWLARAGLQVVRDEPVARGLGTAWLVRDA
jgi:FkbM family methyltransferase